MNNEYNYNYEYGNSKANTISGLTKVFGFMFLGLALTAGISYVFAYLFASGGMSPETYELLLVSSSIGILVVSVLTQVFSLREKTTASLISFLVYILLWGILLSTIIIVYDFKSIGLAFLCTAGGFGGMAAYGYFAKEKATRFGIIGSGLLIGALLISLVNWLIGSPTLYWIISYAILIAMLMITAFDVSRAKLVSDSGQMTTSLAIYFAFQLFVDFIYIFVRIIALIGRSRR